MKRDDVDHLMLSGCSVSWRDRLVEYVEACNDERQRLARDAGSQRVKLERRKGEIARELNRTIDTIVEAGVDPATLAGTIKRLEAERDEIKSSSPRLKKATRSLRCIRLRSTATGRTWKSWQASCLAPISATEKNRARTCGG